MNEVVKDTLNARNRTLLSYREIICLIIVSSIVIKYDDISLLYLVLAGYFSFLFLLRKNETEDLGENEKYTLPLKTVIISSIFIFLVEILLLIRLNV